MSLIISSKIAVNNTYNYTLPIVSQEAISKIFVWGVFGTAEIRILIRPLSCRDKKFFYMKEQLEQGQRTFLIRKKEGYYELPMALNGLEIKIEFSKIDEQTKLTFNLA